MATVYETQTIQVDPNAAPVVNVNLNKNFDVLEAAIISNTVKASGVREITLGIVYDDALVSQHSITLETFTVGNNIADITNVIMADVQAIQFTEFINHTISDDTISVTVLTLSTVSVQVNQFSTQKFQFDPSSPITVGVAVPAFGTFLESHLVNVGSLVKTTTVASGTLNAVSLFVTTV